jgi:pimeloyl-ACP methyl ester carboxylesterase
VDGNPGLVLVHGGRHDSRCWQPTIDAIARLAPARRVLPVNMPGRQRIPGDLDNLTVGDCAIAIRRQIDDAGLDQVVLAGHSLAGIVLLTLAAELGPGRIRGLVALACCVPPNGQRMVDVLSPPVRAVAALTGHNIPRWVAGGLFCNDMTSAQRAFSLSTMVPESPRLPYEPIDLTRIPPGVPRRWILTRQDRALSPAKQRRFAANLGAAFIDEIDAGHNAMISPDVVAALLLSEG